MSDPERAHIVCEGGSSGRLAQALRAASDTREVELGEGAIGRTADVFRRQFPGSAALIVADRNTWASAGEQVLGLVRRASVPAAEPLVFEDPDLCADFAHVERLEAALRVAGVIPIAVGSGTVNDLAKLAAHRAGRPYMVVATAASMDGYTAFGASITRRGSKETFFAPAPRAVIADLDVICRAPADLNAAGYADLIAKFTAGADWILADALGVEAVDTQAWDMVQTHLADWTGEPEAIRRGDRAAIHGLIEGLLSTGFAMQHRRSSRPASGAEHQFSHLWDMEHHRHLGRVPWHGYKVGIGTLAVTCLYEELLRYPLQLLDSDQTVSLQPDPNELRRQVCEIHSLPELREVALRETEAKYMDGMALRDLLRRLKEVWLDLRERLRAQLIPSRTLRQMLEGAGAPCDPAAIGVGLDRLRRSYQAAQQIRRRFTVLDLAMLTGLMPECLERVFARDGIWDRLGND